MLLRLLLLLLVLQYFFFFTTRPPNNQWAIGDTSFYLRDNKNVSERKAPLIDLPSIAFYKYTSSSSRCPSPRQVQIPHKGSRSVGKGTSSHNSTKDGTRQPSNPPEMYYVQRPRLAEPSTNTKSANSSRRANQPWQGH